jgi:hypothetical protein
MVSRQLYLSDSNYCNFCLLELAFCWYYWVKRIIATLRLLYFILKQVRFFLFQNWYRSGRFNPQKEMAVVY